MALMALFVDVSMAQKLKRDRPTLSYKFGEIYLYLKKKHNPTSKATKAAMVKALPAGVYYHHYQKTLRSI